MCESDTFMERKGRQELVMKDVARLWPEGTQIVLEGVLGDQRRVQASLKWIDLEGHSVLLEPRDSGELAEAKAFHGHLGPNVVLGLRMGRIIVDRFGGEPFTYTLTSYTGDTPPISCIMDGLQLATPCTVGNGRLRIAPGGEARVAAHKNGETLKIRVRQAIIDRIKAEYDPAHEEVLPREFFGLADDELFEVKEG